MPPHPLIPFAAAVVAGASLGSWLDLPAWSLGLAAALSILTLLAWGARWARFPVWLLIISGLLAAATLAQWHQNSLKQKSALAALADGRPRPVEAAVLRAPEPARRGWRLVVTVRRVSGRPVEGLLRLSLPPDRQPPPVGSRLAARLRLKPIVGLANPGSFDYAAFMARQGIRVRAWAGKRSGLAIEGAAAGAPWRAAVEKRRQDLGRLLNRLWPGQGASCCAP